MEPLANPRPILGTIYWPADAHESRWQKWERGGFTAREKRVLMTFIFGDAWQQFCGRGYDHVRLTAFLKTGLAMTVTGKNDHAVVVENWGSLDLEDPSKDLTACCV